MFYKYRLLEASWSLLFVLYISVASSSSVVSSSSSTPSFTSTSQASCASQALTPVQFSIRNVTLNDNTLSRGAAVSFGTPPQPFAFLVSPSTNNTFLNDGTASGCDPNHTMVQCSNEFGGLFDQGSSTSWHATTYTALETAAEAGSVSSDVWGTDTVKVNTTFSLPNFPIGVFRSATASKNVLGLGRNSTLLNLLSSAGIIASKSYGYFHGWTGAYTSYQTDGSLVLGGYDAAKITGRNVTLPFAPSDACNLGYVITVTDIKMNLKNGSDISIIGKSSGSSLKACVQPDFGPITLSEDIWWAFTNVTGVREIGRSFSPLLYYGMLIPADSAYDGNLTFSVFPDLEITIPNHQLVVPNIEINSVGQGIVSNYTEQAEIAINSLQSINLNDMPRFGAPFLSSAYLLVDNDNQHFTLWASQQSQTSNLVELGPPVCRPAVTTPSSSAPAPPPKPYGSGPSKAAIAGGIIGGLTAVSLCIGAYFLFMRRLRRQQDRQQEMQAVPPFDAKYSDNAMYDKPEMPSHQQPPQELSLLKSPTYALALQELPPQMRYELPPSVRNDSMSHEMPAMPTDRR